MGDPSYSKLIRAIALQKDGKIVAAGRYARTGEDVSTFVMRLNGEGSVDKEFGKEGIVITKISLTDDPADMAILSDGRIVVTGGIHHGINDNNRGFLASYTPDGKLDESFADTGIATIELSTPINITAIAVTSEGKILIGGYYLFSKKTILLRYNNDGTPDTSFGMNGLAEMSFDRTINSPIIADIAVGTDNTIVTAGIAYLNNSINASVLVSRFLQYRMPDSSFGTNGYTATKYDGDAHANSVAVQSNGKVVTGGYSNGKLAGVIVARYEQDGIVDSSFGVNGISNTKFTGDDVGSSVLVQNDGKIVVSGYSYTADSKDVVTLARYNGDNNKKQIIATRIRRWLQHHGISWQMDNNVRYYNVQRSNDGGVTYQPVAKIYNNHQPQYNYEDAAGKSNDLYRVAAVGKDGSRSYSNSILLTSESSVSVFPNPVRSTMQLQGLSADSKTNISIVDFTGNVRFSATTNSSSCSINTSNLKPDNYFIRIETNKTITTQPFVKE